MGAGAQTSSPQMIEKIGGHGGTRTRGPLLAKQMLSQLSYTPILVIILFQNTFERAALRFTQKTEHFLSLGRCSPNRATHPRGVNRFCRGSCRRQIDGMRINQGSKCVPFGRAIFRISGSFPLTLEWWINRRAFNLFTQQFQADSTAHGMRFENCP